MKILQLNIEKGRFLSAVIDYITKGNFDIIHLQEVAGGKFAYDNINCFTMLKAALPDYHSAISQYLSLADDQDSFLANATFIRKPLTVLKKEELWFKQHQKLGGIPPTDSIIWANTAQSVMCQLVQINTKQLWFINTHFPWSPTPVDTENKSKLGNVIYDFIKRQNLPFILTGDFNTKSGTTLINKFNALGRNLTEEYEITNTLNPDSHHVKSLFPPGLAVDYIFTDKSLTLKNFHVVDKPTLSDHFGLATEIML